MERIGILIAEPDPIRLEGLAACLERESDLRLVGMGRDYIEACQSCAPGLRVDVILLNLDNPGMSSLRDWSLLRALLPDTQIAGLTEGKDGRVLEAALAGGVVALHQLKVDPRVIGRAARCAASGTPDYDPDLIQRLKVILMHPVEDPADGPDDFPWRSMQKDKPQEGQAGVAGGKRDAKAADPLTKREAQVLELMAQGLDNRGIAGRLDVSISTAKFHISNIYAKLGVRSRVQAVLAGLEHGWLAPV